MENQKTALPKWFWVIAIIALLWNLMGVFSFFQHVFISDEALNALPPAEQDLYNSYPLWTKIAFAFAVFGGVIGSIGLVARKKWAKPAFILSLLGIIPQMSHSLFFTNSRDVYGPGTEVMPVSIILVAVFLLWFATFGIRKDWLN